MSTLPPTSTQQYLELFEDAPVAYHELDFDGVIRRVNHAECYLLGYLPEEIIGRSIFELIHPDERDESRVVLREKLAGIRPPGTFRRRYRTRDRGTVYVELHDRLMRDASGRVCGLRSALIDITERIQAEAELESSRRQLSTVLQSISDAVIAFDSLGTVTLLNRAAAALIGVDPQSAVGLDGEAVFPVFDLHGGCDLDDFSRLLFESLLSPWSGTAWLRQPDRPAMLLHLAASPIETDDGTVSGVVVVLRREPVPQPLIT
jgi:PAS domain S-box-containing protein